MKRKVLTSVFVLIVAAMILPTFAVVQAAPKERLDFTVYIQGSTPGNTWMHDNGYLKGSPDNKWAAKPLPPLPPPDGCAVWHITDAPFTATNVWIVLDGNTILFERLDYTGTITMEWNNLDGMINMHADETITIYLTPADKTAKNVWGTIEIRTASRYSFPPPTDVVYGSFEGHGTGALEGVKVQGDTLATLVSGKITPVRDGFAMGWP